MKAGDRIRVEMQYGELIDRTVEEFRYTLGIFLSDAAREAGNFTALCNLYGPGPESEQKYISNYGEYTSNEVPLWMDIPN